ncbi:MAG TPA: hypothetical protein VK177_20645 [Flavobacteriales bacterium]|nr:hypothetical protein [Flavobacteriales bacterium]
MKIGSYIFVFFISSVKFLFAPGTALAIPLSYWETIIVTCAGGFTGVCVFYFGAGALFRRAERKRKAREEFLRKHDKYIPPKKFTRGNKFVVRTKRRFGLIGLAIVTPALISIPFGSIILARFYPNWKITVPVLFGFVMFWSFFLTTFGHYVKEIFGWN